MTFKTLDSVVIDFDDFRRGYHDYWSDNPESVFIKLEGGTGRQKGGVQRLHEHALDILDRHIPITEFVARNEDRPSPVETRDEVERQLPDDVSDEEFEEEVERAYHDHVVNWWSTMLLNAVELDGHKVEVEWVDGDEPLGLHLYFRDKNLL